MVPPHYQNEASISKIFENENKEYEIRRLRRDLEDFKERADNQKDKIKKLKDLIGDLEDQNRKLDRENYTLKSKVDQKQEALDRSFRENNNYKEYKEILTPMKEKVK